MPIVIGDMVPNRYLSSFVIEVKCMHGDADAYSNHEIVIPKDRDDLVEEVTGLLKKMTLLSRNNRQEDYKKIDLWQKWFGSEYYGEWTARVSLEECEEIYPMSFEWKGDQTCDRMYLSRLDSWKPFYYDEMGIKYTLMITEKAGG